MRVYSLPLIKVLTVLVSMVSFGRAHRP